MRYIFLIVLPSFLSCGKKITDNRKNVAAPLALGDESILLSDTLLPKLLADKYSLLTSTKSVNFQTNSNPCKVVKMNAGTGLISFADSPTAGMVYSNQPIFYLQSSDDVLICDWGSSTEGRKVSQSMRLLYAPFFLGGTITETSKGMYSISSMTKAPISVQTFMLGTSLKSADFSAHSIAVDGYDASKLSQFTRNTSGETIKVGEASVKFVRQAVMTMPTDVKILYLQNLLGLTRFQSDMGVQSLNLGEAKIFSCPNSISAGPTEDSVEVLSSCGNLLDAIKTKLTQLTAQNIFVIADKPPVDTVKALLDVALVKNAIHSLNLNFSNLTADLKESFSDRLSARNFAGRPDFDLSTLGLVNSGDIKNTGLNFRQSGSLSTISSAMSGMGSLVTSALNAAKTALPSVGTSISNQSNTSPSPGTSQKPEDLSVSTCGVADEGGIVYSKTNPDWTVDVAVGGTDFTNSVIIGLNKFKVTKSGSTSFTFLEAEVKIASAQSVSEKVSKISLEDGTAKIAQILLAKIPPCVASTTCLSVDSLKGSDGKITIAEDRSVNLTVGKFLLKIVDSRAFGHFDLKNPVSMQYFRHSSSGEIKKFGDEDSGMYGNFEDALRVENMFAYNNLVGYFYPWEIPHSEAPASRYSSPISLAYDTKTDDFSISCSFRKFDDAGCYLALRKTERELCDTLNSDLIARHPMGLVKNLLTQKSTVMAPELKDFLTKCRTTSSGEKSSIIDYANIYLPLSSKDYKRPIAGVQYYNIVVTPNKDTVQVILQKNIMRKEIDAYECPHWGLLTAEKDLCVMRNMGYEFSHSEQDRVAIGGVADNVVYDIFSCSSPTKCFLSQGRCMGLGCTTGTVFNQETQKTETYIYDGGINNIAKKYFLPDSVTCAGGQYFSAKANRCQALPLMP